VTLRERKLRKRWRAQSAKNWHMSSRWRRWAIRIAAWFLGALALIAIVILASLIT
jgi:hypothetical protein